VQCNGISLGIVSHHVTSHHITSYNMSPVIQTPSKSMITQKTTTPLKNNTTYHSILPTSHSCKRKQASLKKSVASASAGDNFDRNPPKFPHDFHPEFRQNSVNHSTVHRCEFPVHSQQKSLHFTAFQQISNFSKQLIAGLHRKNVVENLRFHQKERQTI
jgi:hypothetical protein